MYIKTKLVYGKIIIRDNLFISDLELKALPSHTRQEVILTARRLSYARCLNHILKLLTTQPHDK